MKRLDEEKAVLSVQGLLRKVAWRVKNSLPGLDFDELVSDGQFVVLKAVRAFDPDRGLKLTTLVGFSLLNYYRGQVKNRRWLERMSTTYHSTFPRSPLGRGSDFDLSRVVDGLSGEAREAVEIALTWLGGRADHARKAIERWFGYDQAVLNKVFEEVRNALEQ